MNSNVTSQFVVMTKEDLEAAVNMIANSVHASSGTSLTGFSISKDNQSDEPSHEQFLTRKEAANLLKVDFSTLWRWNHSGLLSSIKVGPRKVMYRYSDVLSVLNGTCNNNK